MLFDKNTPAPVIERNVPIPPPMYGGATKVQYSFNLLKPGESTMHPCTDIAARSKARKAAYQLAGRLAWQITVRSLPEGIRVWRHA